MFRTLGVPNDLIIITYYQMTVNLFLQFFLSYLQSFSPILKQSKVAK